MGEPVGALAVGNWKAKRNGRIAEMLATILYDTEISTNAVIDGHYQGRTSRSYSHSWRTSCPAPVETPIFPLESCPIPNLYILISQ